MFRHAGVSKLARGLAALGAVAFALSFCVPLEAQVSGGTISGTVTDSSGAVIPNAQLSVRNVATGVATTAVSNADGLYTVPNLLAGTYEVTVSASGFKTEVRSGITLTVGVQQVLNVTMQVGQTSQTVQVTGEAAAVQLASSTISGVVNSNTVRELPLNGRDWASLAALQSGASAVSQMQVGISQDGGNQRSFRGFGNQITISGARPQQNNYRVDGVSINDYTNGGPGSIAGVALGVDGIQEFSVLTSNYTAEYGKTSGGVVNAISRSGTNQFHGDVFEFLRNNALDAANFFDNFTGTPIPPFKRNQFGAAAGGPIRKDRTFFFGSYEGFRQTLGLSNVATVPSLDARNGIIHNSDGTTTTVPVSPLVAPYLGFWHVPNGPLFAPGNTGIFSFAGSEVTTENFASAHIDHKISDKDSLFGTWQYDSGNLSLPDNLDDVLNHSLTGRQLYVLQETHVFSPQLVNSVRFGYNRSLAKAPASATAINPLAANTALGTVPGLYAPEISVSGLGTMFAGGVLSLGYADWVGNSFQAYDDAFLTKGIHSMKFGFAFERQQCNCFNVSATGTRWKFASLTNFLEDIPAGVNGPVPGHYPERGWRDSLFGAYIQDDMRLRPNLTVNLGLRYEPATVFNEVHGYQASLHDIYTDTTIHLGSPLFSNPTYKNFEPRVGFAWDPFGTGKTSIRGGFGVFDMLPLMYEMQNQEQSSAPWILNASAPLSALVPGSFPVTAFQAAEGAKLLRVSYVQQNPSTSYDMTWNLNIERQLTPSLTTTVAYVGSHGVHLPFKADDINDVLPTLTSAGYLWPQNIGSGTVLNPNFGRIDTIFWGNSAFYDGLQAQLTKRMSHGLQVQGSYTWSKTIDYGSGTTIGDNYQSSISSLFFWDQRLRRGLADFNVGQNLTVNYTWNLPTPQSLHGPAAWAVSGWELGGILTLQTGLPLTPNLAGAGTGSSGDPLGLNNADPFDYPNRLTGPGCQSLVNPGNVNNYIKLNCFAVPMATPAIAALCTPFQPGGPPNPILAGSCSNLLGNSGRNIISGPGLANFDFSLFKNNYVRRISETFNVQFRAEFFNVFNRANFLPPLDNSNIFDTTGTPIGNAGLIDATSTAAREIQFALKVIW